MHFFKFTEASGKPS